ncbi:MAG: biotin transporter BioY [Anaerolineae bacterium CG_4_9_14_3_um_filter_57_17]|nr:biotin transporter BioY [bacterium]NCT20171.1 biotin transporter BioY [bacterium]OIO86892.1 MAG: biotin transporter BioY [Anaerolineae bacterium CG2_30_57_67]PJB67490.1 MAG: biotin transporter BioY [Anaerolineae bacterium CG_4_9_14_3_um_filter_57_17]
MNTLAPTLTTRILPAVDRRIHNLLLITAGAALVALLAQVRIPLPFTPVPLTGQTFAVLLVGAALGSRRGAASLTLYALSGALSLPVFAGGASGAAYIFGPTGGYLLGFILSAWVIGLLAERGLERSIRTSMLPFLVGTVIIYALGAAWLAFFVGPAAAITKGVLPFLPGDALKLILAALTLPAAWKLTKG